MSELRIACALLCLLKQTESMSISLDGAVGMIAQLKEGQASNPDKEA